MESPYIDKKPETWKDITETLIENHPLNERDIIAAVLEAWNKILNTKIGGELKIGIDVFPSPQNIGNYLHEIIPVILEKKYPKIWRKGENDKTEKDLTYVNDDNYSVEIKTSSNPNNLYGNRSYGQQDVQSIKSKSGYYIGVNFNKIEKNGNPKIRKIRFGWLDHSDWKAQQIGRASCRERVYGLV